MDGIGLESQIQSHTGHPIPIGIRMTDGLQQILKRKEEWGLKVETLARRLAEDCAAEALELVDLEINKSKLAVVDKLHSEFAASLKDILLRTR